MLLHCTDGVRSSNISMKVDKILETPVSINDLTPQYAVSKMAIQLN